MTKETWNFIITTAAIVILAYTIGYFVGAWLWGLLSIG